MKSGELYYFAEEANARLAALEAAIRMLVSRCWSWGDGGDCESCPARAEGYCQEPEPVWSGGDDEVVWPEVQ